MNLLRCAAESHIKEAYLIDFAISGMDTLREVKIMNHKYTNSFTHAYCMNCATTSTVEHNGLEGYCLGCGTQGILHRCSDTHPMSQPYWLPLYEAARDAACPWCGPVQRAGEQLASSQSAPEWLKAVGEVAVGVAKVAGPILVGAMVLEMLFPSEKA
jgi:hypothetical protein